MSEKEIYIVRNLETGVIHGCSEDEQQAIKFCNNSNVIGVVPIKMQLSPLQSQDKGEEYKEIREALRESYAEGYLKAKEEFQSEWINVEELPNDIDLVKLAQLLKYSDKYEISVQFWPDQIACYIAKDGVDLHSSGGTFDHTIKYCTEYLERILPEPPKQ